MLPGEIYMSTIITTIITTIKISAAIKI